jgi:hypothetical protein
MQQTGLRKHRYSITSSDRRADSLGEEPVKPS